MWEFYASRRRQALGADPNAAHWALAELARRRQFSGSGVRRSERGEGEGEGVGEEKRGKGEGEGQGEKREEEEEEEDGAKGEEKEEGEKTFLALTQNIDGLSIRAGHPPDGIWNLHGSLFDLKCTDAVGCGYRERDNFAEPLTPALAKTDGEENDDDPDPDRSRIPKASLLLLDGIAAKNRAILGEGRYVDAAPKATDYQALQPPTTGTTGDDGNGKTPLRPKPAVLDIPLPSKLTVEELPRCPKCKTNLLRPDVVWFGETLSVDVVEDVDALFARGVDLCLVVGTSSTVWPVAGYADRARAAGARVAVVNTDPGDAKNMRPGDWVFVGGAAEVLPVLLEPVIGLRERKEQEVEKDRYLGR